MKKLFSIALLSIVTAFPFVGCSDDETSTSLQFPDVKVPEAKVFSAEPSPEWVTKLPEADTAKQLFVVAAYEGTTAWISMHEKDKSGKWQMIMSTPGFIGKNGLGKTKEGDAKTPIGVFHFTKAFGIAPDPGCKLPYTQVDDSHYWVGDSASARYNQFVSTRDAADFDTKESEHIVEYVQPYQYCMNISYNEEGKPGLGSAIFLHCYGTKPYTGGCVAIPEADMKRFLTLVQPDCRIAIAAIGDLAKF